MEQQWEVFVRCAKAKAECHQQVARFWSTIEIGFGLSLILLSACITAAALLSFFPSEAVAGLAAISTTLASTSAFLKAADKRTFHEKAATDFRSLMVQMITCKTEAEYERLWLEFNREIMEEPLVPKRFAADTDIKMIMSPEFRQVVTEKNWGFHGDEEENVKNGTEKSTNDLADIEAQMKNSASQSPLVTAVPEIYPAGCM